MKQIKRYIFTPFLYVMVFLFCLYILKYFMKDAAEVSFILATAYFVMLFVRKSDFSLIPNFLHAAAGLFLGFTWVAFLATVVMNVIGLFMTVSTRMRFFGLLLAAFFTILAALNNAKISSKYFEIKSSKIKKKTRVVQISDLHITGPNSKRDFEKVMTSVLQESPDVIVISGDLVDVPRVPDSSCFDFFHQIRTPIVFVTGNHDYYAGDERVVSMLEERGVTVLRGAQKVIKGISFVGVDDPKGKIKIQTVIDGMKLSKDKYKILAYHRPENIEYVASKGFDLMLSGHTHAGQMYPLNYVVRLQFKYVVGFHKIQKMILYINPGTGTWEIPMRIGSKNTVAVFDLLPEKKKK